MNFRQWIRKIYHDGTYKSNIFQQPEINTYLLYICKTFLEMDGYLAYLWYEIPAKYESLKNYFEIKPLRFTKCIFCKKKDRWFFLGLTTSSDEYFYDILVHFMEIGTTIIKLFSKLDFYINKKKPKILIKNSIISRASNYAKTENKDFRHILFTIIDGFVDNFEKMVNYVLEKDKLIMLCTNYINKNIELFNNGLLNSLNRDLKKLIVNI